MEKTVRHILKGNDVKLEGQLHLDIGQTAPAPANERNVTSAAPQVRIVEEHPEFAVMEVTCRCGTKTHIKCEYTDAKSTAQHTTKQNNGENDNESR